MTFGQKNGGKKNRTLKLVPILAKFTEKNLFGGGLASPLHSQQALVQILVEFFSDLCHEFFLNCETNIWTHLSNEYKCQRNEIVVKTMRTKWNLRNILYREKTDRIKIRRKRISDNLRISCNSNDFLALSLFLSVFVPLVLSLS